jgi:hypothetical protein
MGDYQFATHARYRSSGTHSEACARWSAAMQWQDAWTTCHPRAAGFTRSQGLKHSRIDYVFVVPAPVRGGSAPGFLPATGSCGIERFLPCDRQSQIYGFPRRVLSEAHNTWDSVTA